MAVAVAMGVKATRIFFYCMLISMIIAVNQAWECQVTLNCTKYKLTIKMGKPLIINNSLDMLYNPPWFTSE